MSFCPFGQGSRKKLVLIHLSFLLSLRPHTSHTRSVRAHARGPPPYVFAFARGVGTKGQKVKRSQAPPHRPELASWGSLWIIWHTQGTQKRTAVARSKACSPEWGFARQPRAVRSRACQGPWRRLGLLHYVSPSTKSALCEMPSPPLAIPSHGKLACGHHYFESVWTGVRVLGTCRGIDHSGRLEIPPAPPETCRRKCLAAFSRSAATWRIVGSVGPGNFNRGIPGRLPRARKQSWADPPAPESIAESVSLARV